MAKRKSVRKRTVKKSAAKKATATRAKKKTARRATKRARAVAAPSRGELVVDRPCLQVTADQWTALGEIFEEIRALTPPRQGLQIMLIHDEEE